MGTFSKTFGACLVQQGALLNYPSVLKDGNTFAYYNSSALNTITKDGQNLTSRINDVLSSGRDLVYGQSTWSEIDGFTLNGVDQFLKTETFPYVQPEVVYMVVRQNGWKTGGKILDGFADLTMVLQQYSVSPSISGYAGSLSPDNTDMPLDTWAIVRVVFNGVNSKIQVNDNPEVTGNFGVRNANGVTIGRFGEYGSDYASISIKEMIFRKSLAGEHDIYTYLKTKHNVVFRDEFVGQTINTDKWEITNTDPNFISFEQNDALLIHTLPGITNASWFTNMIKSKESATTGVFRFSIGIPYQFDYVCNQAFGLWVSNSEHIMFYNGIGGNNVRFAITQAGVQQYTVDNVLPLDFGEFKIVIDKNHNISAYMWTNDTWVQIGQTFQSVLGKKHIFAGSLGVQGGILSMNDCFISMMDYNTVSPFGTSKIATDARLFNAVPDGITDNADAINTALISGDVLLQNGTFAVGSSILIPSNRKLYIRNSVVKLLTGSFDNVFRNSDPVNGNTNVNVIGLGNAYIDGNGAGNNSVDYTIYGGIANMNANDLYKANLFFMCNVNTFEIKNLICTDRQCYTATIQRSSFGKIHDLYLGFHSWTQNQDGIQSVQGTHDIEMYNFRGYTGDDFVSIYLPTTYNSMWYNLPNKTVGDVYNMNYHDFKMYMNWQHGIIFINGDGNKIHDINYHDVWINFCKFFTYFGDDPLHHLFGGTYFNVGATKDELYNINIDNVKVLSSYAYPALISFNSNCKNVVITNFDNQTEVPTYEILSGDQSENVIINGVQVA